jgi:hypothetical protein
MKKIVLLLSLLIGTIPASSGEIDWDRLSFGITGNYQVPFGDLGRYWKYSAGLGGVGRYELQDRVYLIGTVTFSYYTPRDNTHDKGIPFLWLVNLSGSIQYEIPFSSVIGLLLGFGGDNFTFIFRGSAAEDLGNNYIESEIALHGETGLRFRFGNLPAFDVFTRYSSIFSYPFQIPIWMSGIYIYF